MRMRYLGLVMGALACGLDAGAQVPPERLRVLCDKADPKNRCIPPRPDCVCLPDTLEIVLEGLDEAKLLEIDREVPLGNCSLTTYHDRDGTLELDSFGATEHLEARDVSRTHEQPHATATGQSDG